METGLIALVFATVIAIIVFGIIHSKRTKPNDTQGTIYVYYTDLNTDPSLLLEGTVPINEIASRKTVVFDVKIVNKNSHQ